MNGFTVGIMKSAKKTEQLSWRVITASGGMTVLFYVIQGHLSSVGLCSTMAERY